MRQQEIRGHFECRALVMTCEKNLTHSIHCLDFVNGAFRQIITFTAHSYDSYHQTKIYFVGSGEVFSDFQDETQMRQQEIRDHFGI